MHTGIDIHVRRVLSHISEFRLTDYFLLTLLHGTYHTKEYLVLVEYPSLIWYVLESSSGIIISDMSDHLPIFCFLSYKKQKRKAGKALAFESRPITADGISAMINKLQHIDWNCLEHSTTDDAYNTFIQQLNNIMDVCIPKKKVVIPSRFVIRNPWMTKGLVTSSRTSTKLYHKCMKKTKN